MEHLPESPAGHEDQERFVITGSPEAMAFVQFDLAVDGANAFHVEQEHDGPFPECQYAFCKFAERVSDLIAEFVDQHGRYAITVHNPDCEELGAEHTH